MVKESSMGFSCDSYVQYASDRGKYITGISLNVLSVRNFASISGLFKKLLLSVRFIASIQIV